MDTIGERIRDEREKRSLTQAELARYAKVTKAAISALERGESKNPRPATLLAASDALHLAMRWLIHGTGPRYAPDALVIGAGELATTAFRDAGLDPADDIPTFAGVFAFAYSELAKIDRVQSDISSSVTKHLQEILASVNQQGNKHGRSTT